jgi:hypothetical protein
MSAPKATIRSIQDLAAVYAPRAIEVLADIMDSDMVEPKDRISAAEKLLNRGHGMPTQAVIVAPAVAAQRSLAAAKTDDELLAIVEAKQLPRMGAAQSMITVETGAVRMTEADYDQPAGMHEFDTIEESPIDPMLL